MAQKPLGAYPTPTVGYERPGVVRQRKKLQDLKKDPTEVKFQEMMQVLSSTLKNQSIDNAMSPEKVGKMHLQIQAMQNQERMMQKMTDVVEGNKITQAIHSASLSGTKVKVMGSDFYHPKEPKLGVNTMELGFYAPPEAKKFEVHIMNAEGHTCSRHQVNAEDIEDGFCAFHWDGMDKNNQPSSPGKYQFHVYALDENNKKMYDDAIEDYIHVDTTIQSHVSDIRFENGMAEVKVGPEFYDVKNIRHIQGKEDMGNVLKHMVAQKAHQQNVDDLQKQISSMGSEILPK